jgi:predicted phage tail protein
MAAERRSVHTLIILGACSVGWGLGAALGADLLARFAMGVGLALVAGGVAQLLSR